MLKKIIAEQTRHPNPSLSKLLEFRNTARRRWAALCCGFQASKTFLTAPSEKNFFEPLTPVLLTKKQSSRYESELLLETVAYYIDDMRLIKNIVNEFDMYASILTANLRLNSNKLFAIIAIRNLYPKEYADLVKRKGVIYQVFDLFKAWKLTERGEIQEKIQSILLEIEERKELIAKSIEELRVLLWYR